MASSVTFEQLPAPPMVSAAATSAPSADTAVGELMSFTAVAEERPGTQV